jgi:hypothetical protein
MAAAHAIRTKALAQARQAAQDNRERAALAQDIESAFAHADAAARVPSSERGGTLGPATNEMLTRETNAFFAADRRVQADCMAAGHDIGPLRP